MLKYAWLDMASPIIPGTRCEPKSHVARRGVPEQLLITLLLPSVDC
jgi:hypothetical protein